MALLVNSTLPTSADLAASQESTAIIMQEKFSLKEIPLFEMLSLKKGKKCATSYTSWAEVVRPAMWRFKLKADLSAASTTLKLENAQYLTIGTILSTFTGEYMRVSAVDYTKNEATVTRGYVRTTAAPLAVSNQNHLTLLVVGSAFAEGTGITNGTVEHNQLLLAPTQIFKESWGMTNTALESGDHMGSNSMGEQAARALQTLKKKQEAAILFGRPNVELSFDGQYSAHGQSTERVKVDGVDQPIRTFGGIGYWIGKHGTTKTLTTPKLSYTAFCDTILEPLAMKPSLDGSQNRVWVGGMSVFKALRDWSKKEAKETLFEKKKNPFDWSIFEIENTFMNLTYLHHPFFDEPQYLNTSFIFDPLSPEIRPYREKLLESGNDRDGKQYAQVEELSFIMKGAQSGMILKNFQGAA